MDKMFIAILHGDTVAWVRADQILGIDESPERTLVCVAYLPPNQWIQSDEPAIKILRRIEEIRQD